MDAATTEEWRDISGFAGIYQVSSLGNVRSCRYGNKLLKPALSKITADGIYYRKVTLCVGRIRQQYSIARLVAIAFHPNPNNKATVDHINRNPADNRACNLRWATLSENAANKRTKNPLGLKGVQKHRLSDKFQAHICINGHCTYLGLYNTLEEAHAVYVKKAIEIHGEFWAN